MSEVNHPAHYGGEDNPYEVIKVLRQWLSPTEFLGFCRGNLLKYTARAHLKGGVEDHQKAAWYGQEMLSFIADQRAEGEPDGLPVEPVFWTDIDPTLQADEDEVLACAPILEPFLLCSSVEPHARWAVITSSEDRTPFFRKSRKEAQILIEEAQQEGRRQRQRVINLAHELVAEGNLNQAGQVCDENDIDFNYDGATGLTTIDGQTFPEADGPEEAAQADDGA